MYGMLYSLKSFVSRISPATYPFRINPFEEIIFHLITGYAMMPLPLYLITSHFDSQLHCLTWSFYINLIIIIPNWFLWFVMPMTHVISLTLRYRSDNFQCYQTNKYKLSMYETPSGCKFVMNTSVDWNAQAINEILHSLYKEVTATISLLFIII